ncbi:hypothetical protein J6590_031068 [Homalodisca vitripennis]|nr:hypothetical protein J6590_031068 [Homalodisca vitripennis]
MLNTSGIYTASSHEGDTALLSARGMYQPAAIPGCFRAHQLAPHAHAPTVSSARKSVPFLSPFSYQNEWNRELRFGRIVGAERGPSGTRRQFKQKRSLSFNSSLTTYVPQQEIVFSRKCD